MPDDFQPGYADVPFNYAHDLLSLVDRVEMIDVLRTYDGHAASKFADMTRFLSRHSHEQRETQGFEFAFETLKTYAEDFVLYRPTKQEDCVVMTQPTPQAPKPAGSAKPPQANGGAAKKEADAQKPKQPAPPREKKYPAGASEASKISFGADKSGKKYGPDHNPKKGAAAGRFAKYKEGMTVGDALKAGVSIGDIRWDSDPRRGFIKLS